MKFRLYRPRLRRRPGPAASALPSPPSRPDIPRVDRFGFADLLAEATTDIGSRPTRLILTVAGTVLGVGTLIATVGFAQTSALQIAQQFEAANGTQALVSPTEVTTSEGESVPATALPWDSTERLTRLSGVESAALLSTFPVDGARIQSVPLNDPAAPAAASPALVAASANLLDAVGGSIVTGRMFDKGHDARADRVAVLGARAAEILGIDRVDTQPSIFIDEVAYAVIGVFDGLEYRGELRDAVVVPVGTARAELGLTSPDEVQVRLAPGSGPVLREQAPLALAPDAPKTVSVAASRGPSVLSQGVRSDLSLVFAILSALVLLAGGVGIANVTTLSVMERIGEIGLRRALGATRRQIAGQFIVESTVVGLLGGILGAALGVCGVVAIALAQGWSPVTDPLIAMGGVMLGAIVGLVAGGLPARRAARVEPVDALRDG